MMLDFFDNVWCVNLTRRSDRWAYFQRHLDQADWPFGPVERFEAIDGAKTGIPYWWKALPGVWGCYRSHIRILEDALNRGTNSLLILEDDVVFANEFAAGAKRFLEAVPSDWDQIYFGGKVVGDRTTVNKHVDRVNGVILTHAYALRGEFIGMMYEHLTSFRGGEPQTIEYDVDEQMAQLHRNPDYKIYCPHTWLARQTRTGSDVNSFGAKAIR